MSIEIENVYILCVSLFLIHRRHKGHVKIKFVINDGEDLAPKCFQEIKDMLQLYIWCKVCSKRTKDEQNLFFHFKSAKNFLTNCTREEENCIFSRSQWFWMSTLVYLLKQTCWKDNFIGILSGLCILITDILFAWIIFCHK